MDQATAFRWSSFAGSYPERLYFASGAPAEGAGDGGGAGGANGAAGDAGTGDGAPGDGEGRPAGSGSANGAGSGDGEERSEVEQLRAELAQVKRERGAARAEAQERRILLEKIGATPEEIAEFRRDKAEREQRDREENRQYEAQLQIERSNTAREREQRESQQALYEASLVTQEVIATAAALGPMKEAMEPVPGVEGGLPQIAVLVGPSFQWNAEKRKSEHKTERDEDGNPLGLKAYMQRERTKTLANQFVSNLKPGAGAGGGEGGDAAGRIKIRHDDPKKLDKFAKLKSEGKGHLVDIVRD